jgi:preprotein translocase subunit YajC
LSDPVQLIVLLVLLALAWGLVILPQQRRVKAHRAFVASLHVGDEVITTAGVYGTVTELSDDRARLEIAPGVVITIARLAIGRAASTDDAPADGPAATDDLPE